MTELIAFCLLVVAIPLPFIWWAIHDVASEIASLTFQLKCMNFDLCRAWREDIEPDEPWKKGEVEEP